jgi:hypothetical protein
VNALIVIADLAITKATPLPSARKARVTKAQAANWPAGVRTTRTCQHCKTIYQYAGWAWSCEHWHEGL